MIMADLKCPACGELILDDSKYCDMCGIELLQCLNCSTLGTPDDLFCPDCGKPMISRKTVMETKPPVGISPVPEEKMDIHGTGRSARRRSAKKIVLKYQGGGIDIVPEDGAIIGAKNGPYQSQIARLPENFVSRKHGRFECKNGQWYIVDLDSTNGCAVNDVLSKPNEPMPFNPGDVVDIGTHLFDVVEV